MAKRKDERKIYSVEEGECVPENDEREPSKSPTRAKYIYKMKQKRLGLLGVHTVSMGRQLNSEYHRHTVTGWQGFPLNRVSNWSRQNTAGNFNG
ncbi:hypothetical protein VNO78_00066 [Psophocarpus tetragonolobus]|uniref:Uncharacterized protein n=1 Tax=Psophocarpus tetragonolobus TaxID=3891 RepID=A0AAN9SWN8_PSOTE